MSLELIGTFVGALFLPWAFKWAWAPLIDLIKLDRLGGRRAWIIFCTIMMILTLMVTAMVDFKQNFNLLLAMIVVNNLFCATQDVAIDSLAVSTLKPNERGRGNGFMFAGQYFGIMLGGGVAVFVSGMLGFEVTLSYISGLLFINLLFVLFYVQDPEANPTAKRQRHIIRKLTIGALALAYAMPGTIQVDYGLNSSQIAALQIYNTLAGAIGRGHWLHIRWATGRSLRREKNRGRRLCIDSISHPHDGYTNFQNWPAVGAAGAILRDHHCPRIFLWNGLWGA